MFASGEKSAQYPYELPDTFPGTGRHVLMNGTQRALTSYGYSFWEFQVYGLQP